MYPGKNNFRNFSTPIKRREVLKNFGLGSISLLFLNPSTIKILPKGSKVKFDLSLDNPTRFFDGENCFTHPIAGIVPGGGKNQFPRVVMIMNTQDLSGSDVFKAVYGMKTDNLGESWTNPKELDSLAPRFEVIEGEKRPVAGGGGCWPSWHKASKMLLATGQTVVYTPDWKVKRPRPRHVTYTYYDSDKSSWMEWKKLQMPDYKKFHDCGAGCIQRFDKEDGTILLPVAFHPDPLGKNGSVTVTRCSFHNKKLNYLEHGNEISMEDDTRGLYEPSITRYKEEYFLTIRHDNYGFVTRSQDGLHFSPIQRWKFDDGSDLGNYNTQQHWVTHSDGLFLVYTRRGADNDHVFRHRAPLFMAQVDPEKLCVIRETEQILVPERGARLGNFGITDVSPDETWVTVAEWMQPRGVEKHGSDGSLWVARIHWNKPNLYFKT